MPTKASALPVQKSEQLAKPMTSKVQRHVKSGSTLFDSAGEAVSIMAAAFGRTFCELGPKTITGFLFGWIFHWSNGAR
jgi:hypothetical protein